MRPGFQTWTPRRGRVDNSAEEEPGTDSALDAAKAAAAAALGSAQAHGTSSSGAALWLTLAWSSLYIEVQKCCCTLHAAAVNLYMVLG